MTKKWFRFYVEVPDDPKIHRLSDSQFRFWVNCLCLAARNNGTLPAVSDIAHHIRKPEGRVNRMINELSGAHLLDHLEDGSWTPHNWKSRQYESDSSTGRVREFRKRSSGVSETSQERFMKPLPSVSVSVSDSVSEIGKRFREFWARWCELTKRRQREGDALHAWLSVIETAKQVTDAMACLERYGASADVAKGVITNPEKWIYEQARDGWRGDWQPPPKNKRDKDDMDVARKLGLIE